MTRDENILVAIVEECVEIPKDLTKLLRFGDQTDYSASNASAAMIEFYQLCAMIELGQEAGILPAFDPVEVLRIKTEKIQKFAHFVKKSEEGGHVTD